MDVIFLILIVYFFYAVYLYISKKSRNDHTVDNKFHEKMYLITEYKNGDVNHEVIHAQTKQEAKSKYRNKHKTFKNRITIQTL